MKKIIKVLTLIIWISISLFEILTYLFVNPKPIYWRAWEAVSNYTGKDANVAPFKPRFVYNGTMTGDLLNAIKFKSLPSDIRKQAFIVDEYGYRNQPGFLKNKIDAIVFGSSFVGGGQETQGNLASELLTNLYKIRTYNLYGVVQTFWEDARFLKNKPKYVILLGHEAEIINSLTRYAIVDTGIIKSPKAWDSYESWKKENEEFVWAYDKFADRLKNYSLTRFYVNRVYIDLLNFLLTREQIAELTTQDFVTYDLQSKMLFFQANYDNPLINTPGKTETDIQKAIQELLHTKELLASIGVELIVAAMPSKTHIELGKYRNIPDNKCALFVLNRELEKAGIHYIDLLTPSLEFVRNTKGHLYYPDDSHWNSAANRLASRLLKEKITQIENNKGR